MKSPSAFSYTYNFFFFPYMPFRVVNLPRLSITIVACHNSHFHDGLGSCLPKEVFICTWWTLIKRPRVRTVQLDRRLTVFNFYYYYTPVFFLLLLQRKIVTKNKTSFFFFLTAFLVLYLWARQMFHLKQGDVLYFKGGYNVKVTA